jgi:hypothetical protein
MSAVASVVESVVGGAVDVVESVGNAVEDVGNAIIEEVVEPVVDTVDKTIQAAIEDPVGTAVKVAAISTGNPAIIAAANAAVAVANGASLEDAALAAGKGYAAGVIGAEVSSSLSPELAQSGDLTASQAASVAKVAGQVAGTTAVGGDPLQALINGGLNAGVSAAASEVPGFEDMTKTQQNAVTRAIASSMQGRDPSQALINAAIGAGVDAAKNFDFETAPSSELVDQVVPDEKLTTDSSVVNTYQPTEQDTNDFLNSIGIDPSSLSTLPASDEDPLAFLNETTQATSLPETNPQEKTNTSEATTEEDDIPEIEVVADRLPKEEDPTYIDLEEPPEEGTTPDPIQKEKESTTTKPDTSIGDMVTQFLNTITPQKVAGLAGLAAGAAGAASLLGSGSSGGQSGSQTTDQATAPTGQTVNWNPQTGTVDDQGVAYGLAQLDPRFTVTGAQGGIVSLASGGMTQSSLGGYAAGGNPRLLKGPGDGMSDNIPATISGRQPARLADGEFVVPADVVSHLGNGSTDAGANVLYQMMERVRKARTGNSKQGKQINPKRFIPSKGK